MKFPIPSTMNNHPSTNLLVPSCRHSGKFRAVKSARRKSLDRLTPERQSWNMSRIRGKDTTPEKIVRSLLHKMGYRFRLHVPIQIPLSTANRQLSDKRNRTPRAVSVDILLPKYKTAIFVHGCFWHRHRGCRNCTTPTHRREFWKKKLEG